MALSAKKKRVLAGAAGALFGLLGVSFIAAAAGTGNGYTGPGPNMPPGKKQPGPTGTAKPTGPSGDRPTNVEPWDLWISPDCTDVIVGTDWRSDTAGPAIDAWLDDGVPAREGDALSLNPDLSPERVVREILGPYAPLCIDTWPWRDVQIMQNPEPQPDDFEDYDEYLIAWQTWDNALAEARDSAFDDYPQLGDLILSVYQEVIARAAERYGLVEEELRTV